MLSCCHMRVERTQQRPEIQGRSVKSISYIMFLFLFFYFFIKCFFLSLMFVVFQSCES